MEQLEEADSAPGYCDALDDSVRLLPLGPTVVQERLRPSR